MTDAAQERAQLLLEEGATLYESGKLYEAIACWKQVLVLDPDNEIASEYLRFVEEHFQISQSAPPPPPSVGPPEPPPPPVPPQDELLDESMEELDWSELLTDDPVSVAPSQAQSIDGDEDFFAELSQVISSPTGATPEAWTQSSSNDEPEILSSMPNPEAAEDLMPAGDPMQMPSSAFSEAFESPSMSGGSARLTPEPRPRADESTPVVAPVDPNNRDLSEMSDESIELMLDLDFRAWEDSLLGSKDIRRGNPTPVPQGGVAESPSDDLITLDPEEAGFIDPVGPADWPMSPPVESPPPPASLNNALADPIGEVDIELGDFDADLDAVDFEDFESRVPGLEPDEDGPLDSIELESLGFTASQAPSNVFDIPGAEDVPAGRGRSEPPPVEPAPAGTPPPFREDFVDVGAELAMELSGPSFGNDFDLSGGFDQEDLAALEDAVSQEQPGVEADDFGALDEADFGDLGGFDESPVADALATEADFPAQRPVAADAPEWAEPASPSMVSAWEQPSEPAWDESADWAVESAEPAPPEASDFAEVDFADVDFAEADFAESDFAETDFAEADFGGDFAQAGAVEPDFVEPEPVAVAPEWSEPSADWAIDPIDEGREVIESDPVPDLSGPMFGEPSGAKKPVDSELEALLRSGLDDLERIEQSAPPPPAPRQLISAPPPDTDFDGLMREARRKQQAGDFSGSLALVEQVLAGQPTNAEALRYQEENAHRLLSMYRSRLGNVARCPKVKLGAQEIIWQSLDHRSGFILSQVDGMTSFEDIVDIAGMPELEASRILARLVEAGVIG